MNQKLYTKKGEQGRGWVFGQPEARVVPTPLRLVRVATALSRFGSFLNAFLDSVCTARGVFMRTKFVNWG